MSEGWELAIVIGVYAVGMIVTWRTAWNDGWQAGFSDGREIDRLLPLFDWSEWGGL